MKLSTLILAAFVFAFPAWGANSLEALRTKSRDAREQVAALRSEQLKYRSELSTLSARIEKLKAASVGKLLRNSELDAALKRSQELSSVLSELSMHSASKESVLETANLALLEGLSTALISVRSDFDNERDRTVRRGLIEQLRELRVERDALRQTLPASILPALDPVKPSEDPEELLEQADLLRDNEEKLRREMKSLEVRIAERKEEAELDRRVQRFVGEDSMFDDSDRRLRARQTVSASKTTANAPRGDVAAGPLPVSTSQDSAPQAGAGESTDFDSNPPRVVTGSDARVQVGAPRAIWGTDSELSELEREKSRLEGLASQLKKQADQLQQRASQLK